VRTGWNGDSSRIALSEPLTTRFGLVGLASRPEPDSPLADEVCAASSQLMAGVPGLTLVPGRSLLGVGAPSVVGSERSTTRSVRAASHSSASASVWIVGTRPAVEVPVAKRIDPRRGGPRPSPGGAGGPRTGLTHRPSSATRPPFRQRSAAAQLLRRSGSLIRQQVTDVGPIQGAQPPLRQGRSLHNAAPRSRRLNPE